MEQSERQRDIYIKRDNTSESIGRGTDGQAGEDVKEMASGWRATFSPRFSTSQSATLSRALFPSTPLSTRTYIHTYININIYMYLYIYTGVYTRAVCIHGYRYIVWPRI